MSIVSSRTLRRRVIIPESAPHSSPVLSLFRRPGAVYVPSRYRPLHGRCAVKMKNAKINWSRYRKEFPAAKRYIYFNHAAVSPLSTRVLDAMNAVSNGFLAQGVLCEEEVFARIEKARKSAARLIGARSGEIAFIKNTTQGVLLAADGIRWKRGDNVVMPSIEFPANVYPVARPRETRRACRLREAAGRQNHGGDARGRVHRADPLRDGELGPVLERLSRRSRGARAFLPRTRDLPPRRRHPVARHAPVRRAGRGDRFSLDRRPQVASRPRGDGVLLLPPRAPRRARHLEPRLERREERVVLLRSRPDAPPGSRRDSRKARSTCTESRGSAPRSTASSRSAWRTWNAGFSRSLTRSRKACARGDTVIRAPAGTANAREFSASAIRRRDTETLYRRLGAARVVVSLRTGAIRLTPHFYNTEREVARLLDLL